MAIILDNGSQRLYSISNPIKLQRMKGKMNENKNPCLLVLVKNPSFSNLSFPESTGPRAAGSQTLVVQNAIWRKRKKEGEEEERREEEDGYELPL